MIFFRETRTRIRSVPCLRSGARGARTAILDGEYLPGERLVEATLCQRVEASRFTVRTVLQDLAAEGLVAVRRNLGAQDQEAGLA